jgi:ABC-2 type transport system ATP-binding protein
MDTLRLHISETDPVEALVKVLQTMPGIKKADQTDHTIDIITPSSEEVLAPVIIKANEIGVKIRSVDIKEPDLESVFLHLTGRALRD